MNDLWLIDHCYKIQVAKPSKFEKNSPSGLRRAITVSSPPRSAWYRRSAMKKQRVSRWSMKHDVTPRSWTPSSFAVLTVIGFTRLYSRWVSMNIHRIHNVSISYIARCRLLTTNVIILEELSTSGYCNRTLAGRKSLCKSDRFSASGTVLHNTTGIARSLKGTPQVAATINLLLLLMNRLSIRLFYNSAKTSIWILHSFVSRVWWSHLWIRSPDVSL